MTATATRPAPRPRNWKPATVPVCGSVLPKIKITTDKGVVSEFGMAFPKVDPEVATAAIRLVKDDGEIYDVHLGIDGLVRCDCPDGIFHGERPGGCKHIVALRAMILKMAGLLALAEAPTEGGYPPAPKTT